MKRLVAAVLAASAGAGLSVCLAPATAGARGHGFALFSELKHGPDFEHFDYVNPAAPKGGTIRQGSLLPFNSTNVMRFPGNTPNELSLTFDSLMVRAQDEPAAFYGLLAEHVEIEPAFAAVRFRLREEARWHDGTPVTAADVAFTFTTLREHGLPGHQSVLRGVRIDVIDERVVEFSPAQPADWRYVELVATFPIQSAAFWRAREVGETTLDVPLGSGPYRLVSVEVNQRTVLSRDPAYWAAALAVNRGRWNVDRIETLYFRERNAKIEALRAGLLDIAREFNAASWARDYDGPRLARGELVRTIHRERSPGTLAALLFNLRRPPLDDRRVRAALACAFDAHWV
ncbi:MAG: ABC transporter substrate-binding protein, partial [Pseudomonadota bacterium]